MTIIIKSVTKPDYGNWVSVNMIKSLTIGLLFSVVFSILSFCPFTKEWSISAVWIARIIFLLLAAAIIFATAYFCICRALFSYDGRYKIQNRVLDYVLSHFEFDKGNILDIGCGSGALSIKTIKKFPSACVTGMDYWGTEWNYAKEQCEKNAELEGVADRVAFQKGDAAKLDFPDEHFDGAVSNFVFHEVKGQPDKRLVVKEALRVVKKGGMFAFHDLFLEKHFYGNIEEFISELKNDGISEITFLRSNEESFIPKLLKSRIMLGKIGLIYGRK